MAVDKEFREEIFFESVREFWNERGRGARYRLTTVGTPFFKEKVNLKKSREENFEIFKKYLIDNDYIKSIEFSEDEFSFSINANDCCLMNVRKQYEKHNMEILCCPIANMFMEIFELETGMSPELLPVEIDGGKCKLSMAKMGTDEVTETES